MGPVLGSKNESNVALKQCLLTTCQKPMTTHPKNQHYPGLGVRICSPDPPLEDDKSSSSPKERGTLVQRTCAQDDGKSDGSLRTSESSWRSAGRKPPNKVRSGGGDEGDGKRVW